MLFAFAVLAMGTFSALVLRRLKMDTEEEKTFRAQLSGSVRIDDHTPLLS